MLISLTALRLALGRVIDVAALMSAVSRGEPAPARDAAARHVYAEFNDGQGIDATRYGDWEYTGRCTDF